MQNHRTTAIYSDSFRGYLAHTDEKSVLFSAVSKRLRVLGTASLLDIGAGDGDLSIPLAKQVERYLAVEQKDDYAKRLRDAGLTVVASAFPCTIAESFDAVFASHSVPSQKDGVAGWEPFLASAWSQVNEHGHLLIITFEDEESEWSDLVATAGLEEVKPRKSRLGPLKDYLTSLGKVEVEVITTHVRTKALDEMLQALAFVWSDGRAHQLEAFLQNQKVAARIEQQYWDGKTYSFPFHHYLLDVCH
jgi:SAM-dependent methyltransferase